MQRFRNTNPAKSTMDEYHRIIMDTFDTVCHVKARLGGKYLSWCHVMDGQKYVCMDDLMDDISRQDCLVYSFGIGGDWTFEDEISSFGCKVYAYDPTIDHKGVRSNSISFKKIGLVGKPKKDTPYQTLSHILKENGHINTTISYLKLDIEANEIYGLPIWLKSGALKNVNQIAMEIHLLNKLGKNEEKMSQEFLQTLKDLALQANFRIFNWEANSCWKNTFAKNHKYFSLVEIVMKRISPTGSCAM